MCKFFNFLLVPVTFFALQFFSRDSAAFTPKCYPASGLCDTQLLNIFFYVSKAEAQAADCRKIYFSSSAWRDMQSAAVALGNSGQLYEKIRNTIFIETISSFPSDEFLFIPGQFEVKYSCRAYRVLSDPCPLSSWSNEISACLPQCAPGFVHNGDRCVLHAQFPNPHRGLAVKDQCVANPISLIDGAKIQVESDYLSQFVGFKRRYVSHPLFGRWTNSFDYGINFEEQSEFLTTVRVRRPLRGDKFFVLTDGRYISSLPDSSRLEAVADGWLYKDSDSEEIYDVAGKIIQAKRDGVDFSFHYVMEGGWIKEMVVHSHKREILRLLYLPQSRNVESVHAGGRLVARFNYDTLIRLVRVVYPSGVGKHYHYEDPRFPTALTGITDEKGVRFATWRYDEQGRAISSEHAGGAEKTTLSFNADGSTTVTNPLGKKTHYLFENVLGKRRVSRVTGEPTANCVGANQQHTYTASGQVDTQTDWNGNVTKFTYDNQNREISRTEAFGTPQASTTQTCWHATFNKPARVIESKQVVQYQYDATGKLIQEIRKPRPVGVVDCATTF